MTDRQVTESSIGLAGRLSHLPYGLNKAEDSGWHSTRNLSQKTPVFEELGPTKTWFSAASATSVHHPSSSASSGWHASRQQQRWLLKAHPEARLGNECIHEQLLSAHLSPHEPSWGSAQFAIGEITDTSSLTKVSGVPLVVIATGEANDVLRLVKPSIEEWQWGDDDSVSLLLPDVREDDESVLFQEDLAGPIRRLKTVVDSKRYDPTRWVIVQRNSGTCVLQPEYGRTPMISSHNKAGRPSRIAPNPLFFLAPDQTGGSPHSDAAFNPAVRSKPPQLGLIDECGYWSVWDVLHTKVRSSRNPKVRLSGCGHVEKGVMASLPVKGTGPAQWHRILWVGCSEDTQAMDFEEDADVLETQGSFPQLVRSSTLLLCSPQLVRLLDLATNSFLPDLSFTLEGGRDCILDVDQNPEDTQYVFVLTTVKLFVVRVFSSPGQSWGETRKQWAIILSVSHLRDGSSRDLKLVVAPGASSPEQATSLVYIRSSSNTRLDLFCVAMQKRDPFKVTYHSEAVALDVFGCPSLDTELEALHFQPARAVLNGSKTPTQSARALAKQEVRFYQLAALRKDICLISTLCVSGSSISINEISRPDRDVSRAIAPVRERKRMLRHMSSHFIVSEDVALEDGEDELARSAAKEADTLPRWPMLQRPVGLFYEHLSSQINEYDEASIEANRSGSSPLDQVHSAIELASENRTMPAATLFQIVENFRVPKNMNLAATEWETEIERLGRINPDVILLTLNQPLNQITRPAASLHELHSMLLDLTAGTSPGDEEQNWIQQARSTALQQIACDVHLSLHGLVYRQAELADTQQSLTHDLDNMVIDSQQDSQQESVAGSSARAQSVVSAASSKGSAPEAPQEEDPAIALLRSYTGTGKFVPAKHIELLDKWKVGANPSDYVFDLDKNKEVTPGMQKRVKELARQSRKRRRAETLLQMQNDGEPSLPATQPAPDTRFFSQHSQPVKQYSQSQSQSQALFSDPLQTMSQPIPGTFGRRAERPRKKVKRRIGGF
ncbi:hypothetical protein GGR54DRAFT_3542 [Hypoxylon sp. NC1633]|nr:hypothetical protein GGR54DRAFT_3542 [Hypoxylon sp. NC1633]